MNSERQIIDARMEHPTKEFLRLPAFRAAPLVRAVTCSKAAPWGSSELVP